METSGQVATDFFKIMANSPLEEGDVPIYCVVRICSFHHGVDEIVSVHLSEESAYQAYLKIYEKLPKRSKKKIYVQTSILKG